MLTSQRKTELYDNFSRVRERIENAKARRGAGPDVALLAATKTVPAEDIVYATENLGLTLAGENRVQELCAKYPDLVGKCDLHLIGTLQTRKVRDTVGKVSMIESVDSLKLASEIDRRSREAGVVTDVLLEVNIGREENKSGVLPENVGGLLDEISSFEAIRPAGIMTMAPICTSEAERRKYFSETYRIFIDIYLKKRHNIIEPVLSMGMSDSFEEAILEGATEVRVGSALFGSRNYAQTL